MTNNQFYEIEYPSSRQLTMDVGRIGREKHHIKALLEADVTEARRKIKQHRQAGKKIAFTAWLIKVIADCVALHPPVNGLNRPRGNKVVVFNEVNVSIVAEKEVGGVRVPLPYLIRKADQKTLDLIHAEIESARSQKMEDEGNYVLGGKYSATALQLFVHLPAWLRLFLMRVLVLNNPRRMNEMMGTVMFTTVGMVGHTRGWIIPYSIHPLCLAIGSLNEQPAVIQGDTQKREILHITVLFDHDVIDGMPAARFVDDLVKKMEAGWGL
jgi:pyruvate/2-oxoglutarate dehydrogenase complex dihydrolipoamide acyltransferase (E2) component